DQALTLWRGPVLSGAEDRVRRHPAAHYLHRRRLDAALAYAGLAIAGGEHQRAKRKLLDLAEEEPLHEGLHAALMIALAGSGEQAAALTLFTQMRRRLADQLGVDPGAEIMDA